MKLNKVTEDWNKHISSFRKKNNISFEEMLVFFSSSLADSIYEMNKVHPSCNIDDIFKVIKVLCEERKKDGD